MATPADAPYQYAYVHQPGLSYGQPQLRAALALVVALLGIAPKRGRGCPV